ncbi:DUF2157 domain-containing protein [Microvirga sp. W0021]|uniref:DUF2157 domain-containing protein n=1 Tax=Hohaiivirga grylli TaxID=3133970 RepID=A0ABV0BEZ2_9HYPH
MTPKARNAVINSELAELLRDGDITRETYLQLKELYPVEKWDWRSLGRWFLLFGAVSFAAGIALFLRDIFDFSYEKLAVLLSVTMLLFFAGAQWLKVKGNQISAEALELLSAFALIGLTFTIGIIFSNGSGDWPSLVLADFIIILPLTYLLRNKLLLILVAILFFVWFGGRTGYISGWGAYWFSMNYPLRFFMVSMPIIAMGAIHMLMEKGFMARFRGFAKIWISIGIFFMEMALWLMSIFGNYDLDSTTPDFVEPDVFGFNLLWISVNITLIVLGARLKFRMLRGYGVTFLIIHGYTLFFTHIGGHLSPLLTAMIGGILTLALAFAFEKMRKKSRV